MVLDSVSISRMKIELDFKKIVDCRMGGIDMSDAPDFCDAYVAEAWLDLGNGKFRELSEKELDFVNENAEFVLGEVQKFLY